MRTVVALLLLAVAANAYTVKMGGLKGAWYTNFIITGPADDIAAPTIDTFTIDDAAANLMWNITDNYYTDYYYFDYNYQDDVDDYPTCATVFQMWDSTATTVLNDLVVSDYFGEVYAYVGTWPGTYSSMVSCYDMSGNSMWWDSSSTGNGMTYDIMLANHAVDTDGFVLSNIQVDGAATSTVTIDSAFDSQDIVFTVDIADVATPGMYDQGCYAVRDFMLMGTWVSLSTGVADPTWTYSGSCTYNAGGADGSCTATWTVYNTQDIGALTVTSVSVRDFAGNATPMTTALVVTITNTASMDVISCQTLTLDLSSYSTIIDVTTFSDDLYLDAGCTIKTSVATVTNTITVSYAHLQVMSVDGVTMSGTVSAMSYGGYDTFDSTGAATVDIYFNYGLPGGLYYLDTLTTVTGYGAIQLYTFALGGASSVAPSMVAVAVAAAVAFLRL